MHDITEFFEVKLPAMIGAHEEAFAAGAGRISFVVEGVGEWVVQLGAPPDRALRRRVCFDADLTLLFSPTAFRGLLAGVPPEAGSGFIAYGDARLLRSLSQLLSSTDQGVVGLLAGAA